MAWGSLNTGSLRQLAIAQNCILRTIFKHNRHFPTDLLGVCIIKIYPLLDLYNTPHHKCMSLYIDVTC